MTDQPAHPPHLLASMPPTVERFSVAIPISEELAEAIGQDTFSREALVGMAKGRLAAALVEEVADRIEVTLASPIKPSNGDLVEPIEPTEAPWEANYRPSNGSEGEWFRARWCEHCAKDDGRDCPIYSAALFAIDGKGPDEWEGRPGPTGWEARCTAFEEVAESSNLDEVPAVCPRCKETRATKVDDLDHERPGYAAIVCIVCGEEPSS